MTRLLYRNDEPASKKCIRLFASYRVPPHDPIARQRYCAMSSVQADAAPTLCMSPYQQCPYCEAVIEIASDDRSAMERHIRTTHAEQNTHDSLRGKVPQQTNRIC